MEKEIITLDGVDYKVFYITIKGKEICVAEEKLNDYILECIDNNTYTNRIIAVDEMFGYVVPQEFADSENEEDIVKSITDIIMMDDPTLTEFC